MESNQEDSVLPETKFIITGPTNILKSMAIGGSIIIGLLSLLLFQQTTAPYVTTFPIVLQVKPGMSVTAIANQAEEVKLVRSSFLLYTLLTLRHDPTSIYAGNYTFFEPKSVFAIAAAIANGNIDDESTRLTIPEGMRARDMALLIERILPSITALEYIELAIAREGYLYPETYQIPPYFKAADIIILQEKTYEEHLAPLRAQIAKSSFTEYEMLTLASIIEREANDETSMKMISGIFQNRLAIGMPLQADASIEYTLNLPLGELKLGELAKNLREVDDPYNTYLYPGLPPTPISNPGLTAIKAVLEPTASEYLYYLTDDKGNFHYAKTLKAHKANIAQYLK